MDFRKIIEENKDSLISDLQGCIRIPSVRAREEEGCPYGKPIQECLEYMLNTAEKMGFSVHNMDNQLGWCEYGEGEEMIAVLCHLDVVPEGDGWTVPPYEGLVADGRIYGRGTMDDKGPAVAALYALLALKEAGVKPGRRIRLIFGANEETGSADVKYYLNHGGEVPVMGFTPDAEYPVINGEKGMINVTYTRKFAQSGELKLTELKGGEAPNIVPAHASARFVCSKEMAGRIEAMKEEKIFFELLDDGIRVLAEGVSAHAGTPWEGESAVGRLMLFLKKLPLEGDLAELVEFFADRFGMECDGASLGIAMEDQVSGPLTVNLGVVEADESRITVKLNYRYPVTCRYEDCAPTVEAAFAEKGFETEYMQHKPRLYMEPDSPLITKLLDVYARCTGLEAKPKCIGGGTYAKMMPNIVAFGPIFPGDEVREHKPDEFMELERLFENADILAQAMYELAR